MLYYAELLAGLLLLIVGGNVLVDGAIIVAKKLKVSPLLIGLLLVGFGMSMPELATSLISVSRNAGGIAIGNVVGANIANILLVLGVAAMIRPIKIHKMSFGRDAIFLALSTIVLLVSLLRGEIAWELGALMCMTLAFYVYHSYETDKPHAKELAENPRHIALSKRFHVSTPLSIILTICGIILTIMGAHLLVDGVIIVAGHLGVSETLIGLTIVAFGTSLPELVTAIIASLKGHSDVAVGNVIGSNIYNALFILGFTSLFLPVSVPETVKPDVLVMTAATLLLMAICWGRGRIGNKTGLGFVALYFMYIIYVGIH